MELIQYLNDVFFTQPQLLKGSAIDLIELDDLQKRSMMPQPSYTLKLDISCSSFFGHHHELTNLVYYAKGYTAWVDVVRSLSSDEYAFDVFSSRYKARLQQLNDSGVTTSHEKLNTGLDLHIKSEWAYFLDGTYGLCTKSGLPEDIAAKELAVTIIKEITEERIDPALSPADRMRLTIAVDLLDTVSNPFAPHELLRSSRHRLINQIRGVYDL